MTFKNKSISNNKVSLNVTDEIHYILNDSGFDTNMHSLLD